jgi:type IV secretion system pilin
MAILKRIFQICLLSILLFRQFTHKVFAQVDIGEAFKTGENSNVGVGQADQFNDVGSLLSIILPNVFMIANLILLFFIILGGFTMATNPGNPDKQKEGGSTITSAVIGFVVIFAAYWIMDLLGIITGFDPLESGV